MEEVEYEESGDYEDEFGNEIWYEYDEKPDYMNIVEEEEEIEYVYDDDVAAAAALPLPVAFPPGMGPRRRRGGVAGLPPPPGAGPMMPMPGAFPPGMPPRRRRGGIAGIPGLGGEGYRTREKYTPTSKPTGTSTCTILFITMVVIALLIFAIMFYSMYFKQKNNLIKK